MSSCSDPGCPELDERYEITAAEVASLGARPDGCTDICLRNLSAERPGGAFSVATCGVVDEDGGQLLACHFLGQCGGRPPAGLLASRGARGRDALGAHFAEAARMELASVPAFLELAHELALHGAPGSMIAAARRSAADEVRHARAMRRLARSVGAVPAPVERTTSEARTLLAMLDDNASAGCTGEAHAALVAAHQAASAPRAVLRDTYAAIARDEARHALLSFAIHDWATARLDRSSARRLEERRRESVGALASACDVGVDGSLLRGLGLPDADRSVALARALA